MEKGFFLNFNKHSFENFAMFQDLVGTLPIKILQG